MKALVDNRVEVEVVQRFDDLHYRFDLGHWVEASPGMYLVHCTAAPPGVPCEHIVHESRILLCPNEEA